MGIMKRFTRICKADINGVMDQIEDKDLILKQCLREMEEAISKKQARANNIRASIEKIVYQKDRFFYDQKKLEKDISSAIEKDKDDMARMLIKKIKTMDQHIDALDQHKTDLEKKNCSAK
jgi:phage shock protein A